MLNSVTGKHMDPHIFYQRQAILSLDSIWKLFFPQNESSSNTFTLSECRALCCIQEQQAGVGSEKQKAGIVQIEIPY